MNIQWVNLIYIYKQLKYSNNFRCLQFAMMQEQCNHESYVNLLINNDCQISDINELYM